MRLFFRLLWPRSRRSLSTWVPLIAVGAVSCAGLSLALGIGFGYHAQQETALLRDGSSSMGPFRDQVEGPQRSTRVEATAYPESTEGGRRVSVLKRQEGAPVNLG